MPSSEVGSEVFKKLRFVLLAVGAVIDPFTRCGDPLPGRDHRGMPDHRDEFAVAACLDPQNTVTVLLIVVRDALDEARQHFLGRWFRLRFHDNCRLTCGAAACQSHGISKPPTKMAIRASRAAFSIGT